MDGADSRKRAAAMRARGVSPIEPYPGSNNPWKCKCNVCGSVVTPRYQTVVNAGKGGCNVCAKKNAASTRKSQSEIEALAIASKLKLHPLEKYPGAHGKWKLECLRCGSVTNKKAQGVLSGHGCQKCSSKDRATKTKSEKSDSAVAIMFSAGLRPLVEYPGSNSPWSCQCLNCGQIVSPRFTGVSSGQGGCKACGTKRRAKARSISEEDALAILAASQARPLVEFPGAAKAWKSICLRCGMTISPSLQNLKTGHGACRRCAMVSVDSSFDFFGPATLYLMESGSLGAYKIGIAGKNTKRVSEHKRNGWTLLEQIETPYGYQVWFAEGKVLEWLRADMRIEACVEPDAMPQGGFTETFPTGSIAPKKVWSRVKIEISSPDMPIPEQVVAGTAKSKARRSCTLIENAVSCKSIYYSNGYCRKHYGAWKAYGSPLTTKKVTYLNKTCEVKVGRSICGDHVDRKGMCSVHYYRSYTYGDPNVFRRAAPQPLPSRCKETGCKGKPYSLGKCPKHYAADRRKAGKR
jgi:hypothetical protein